MDIEINVSQYRVRLNDCFVEVDIDNDTADIHINFIQPGQSHDNHIKILATLAYMIYDYYDAARIKISGIAIDENHREILTGYDFELVENDLV